MLAFLFKILLNKIPISKYEISYYKFSLMIKEFESINLEFPIDPGPYKCVYLDGLWLNRNLTVLIARTKDSVIGYSFAPSESYTEWARFLSKFMPPEYAVCDGQKGLKRAIRDVWPCTKVQRCLFHVWYSLKCKLTLNPETGAGIELLRLVGLLLKTKSQYDKDRWLNLYQQWHTKFDDFINEKTVNKITGEVFPTHERLKSAAYNLDKLIKSNCLFVFLECDEVDSTNNLVEGGINSPIRDLLRSHRGASINHRILIIKIYLLKRSKYWHSITNKLYKKKD